MKMATARGRFTGGHSQLDKTGGHIPLAKIQLKMAYCVWPLYRVGTGRAHTSSQGMVG
jgi:hypothetical protein